MDEWTGAGVSRAVAGKPSGVSDGKVSRVDLAGRAKVAGEAAGKLARAGVLLTLSVKDQVDGLRTALLFED
jgi:hypothetical protein